MLLCYFDGACEPRNPGGNMGIGAAIFDMSVPLTPEPEDAEHAIFKHSHYVKASRKNSNNVAEYLGFISILDWLIENGHTETRIHINGDSNLVIQKMRGTWRIKQGAYVPYAKEAKEKLKQFKNVTLQWIPREKNGIADKLSKTPMLLNGCEFKIQPNE